MMTIKTTKKMVTSAILFSSLLGATVVSSVTSVTTANAAEVTTTAKASDTSSVKMLAKHSATATKQVAQIDQTIITDSITKGVAWLKTLDPATLTAWDAVALGQSGLTTKWDGTGTETALNTTIINNIHAAYPNTTNPQPTDAERDLLGILAAGGKADSLTFTGTDGSTIDLVAMTRAAMTDESADLFALAYGVMAMTSLKLETGSAEYDADIATAINSLLNMRADGYWTDQYQETSDPSSMVMQALAPYVTDQVSLTSDVDGSLNAQILNNVTETADTLIASDMYHSGTNAEGQAVAHIYDNTEYAEANSSSNAAFLTALVACGLTNKDKAGNTVTDVIAQGLLDYQVVSATGSNVEADINSFNWTDATTYDRHLATQQGVYAMDQYQNGTSNWLFDFTNVE